ncbi:bifunctional phosphopantothenoylcysteine decarboxylase/phosphopantothenate--cysteine ligase CoaBC [Methanobrevibacter filiformis]|uniref:Coenzyme A biosynthesis bifunctional protein CoaBC n=1 Tax=Methanobrevibacter filiformis TaxID=55758 RepID=A0A166APL5_9EURY|nr:bifunctional phosphopantothenoylcysteine decarboxylase/phosphopantothenate--cysteine ligase CoaBC [Methanobrevibacter filiformis]KZX12306.1 coenzyme A biosynthesis bifunctional protein CoaBC [Methanobrevibacter filiformis]
MEIILCVTGSIAAIESIKLARALKRVGINVKCFMSDEACKIIHPNAMEFATGSDVVLDLTGKIEHVKYAQADLILVAPATANTISKFTYKIADNSISSLLITAQGHDTPILFVPSMHDSMYSAISENIDKTKQENNVYFVDPKMSEGKAKFPDINDIVLESIRIANIHNDQADFLGKNVLITLGGTFEAIDPIRGINNRSSGKMGLELAKESYCRGANLKLIVGTVSVDIPSQIAKTNVLSSKQMNDVTKDIVNDYDIFIATAAVSDFEPISKIESKISSSLDLSLDFKPTEKIIRTIKDINPNIFLVGFKAEYNISEKEIIDEGIKQIESAGTDLVIANDVGIDGCEFGSDNNEIILIDKENTEKISIRSKKEISKIVFDRLRDKT